MVNQYSKLTREYNLKKYNPKLAKEWDYKKNKTKPEEHTPKVHHKVWWLCSSKHSYQASIAHRNGGSGCPICAGRVPDINNNLKKEFPEIAKRWDYKKNIDKPQDIVSSEYDNPQYILRASILSLD